MARRFLSAESAAGILFRVTCPDDFILHDLVEKVEYVIQTVAKKRCDNVFYRVPIVYSTVPAYNFNIMYHLLAEHFENKGFFVKRIGDGCTLWISWRNAFEKHCKRQSRIRKRRSVSQPPRKRYRIA